MNHISFDDIHALGDRGIFFHGLLITEVSNFKGIGKGRIGKGHGGCSGNGAGHVVHAVVYDSLLHIGGVLMGCGAAGLAGASLIDGNIDNNRPPPASSF